MTLNLCFPLFRSGFVPAIKTYSFESRRIIAMGAGIPLILSLRSPTQISAPIVQSITVSMINVAA